MGLPQGAYAGPFSQVFPERAWHPALLPEHILTLKLTPGSFGIIALMFTVLTRSSSLE